MRYVDKWLAVCLWYFILHAGSKSHITPLPALSCHHPPPLPRHARKWWGLRIVNVTSSYLVKAAMRLACNARIAEWLLDTIRLRRKDVSWRATGFQQGFQKP